MLSINTFIFVSTHKRSNPEHQFYNDQGDIEKNCIQRLVKCMRDLTILVAVLKKLVLWNIMPLHVGNSFVTGWAEFGFFSNKEWKPFVLPFSSQSCSRHH